MPVGNVSVTVRDGGLGIVPSSTANLTVTMGSCSLGTAATLFSFSQPEDLVATLGTGPAVDAAAYKLAAGAGQVYVMPVNASVAGVASAVTATRVATSTGTVSITGAPNDAYSLRVSVVSSGSGQLVTGGTVQVTVSLDGGNTTGAPVFVPTSGTLALSGTGLTLTFSVASTTFDAGDRFTATCQAPFYTSTDLNNAFAALFQDARTWGLVHVVGFPTVGASLANATSAAAIAAAVDTQMSTAQAAFRYARAIVEAPPSADADLTSAYQTFASAGGRTMVVAGTCVLTSPLTGRQLTRSYGSVVAGRLSSIRVSRSPGAVADGPNVGVVSLTRDERRTPGLYDQRFAVGLTYAGFQGFYSDLGRTMAAAGSDYSFIMNGRVMDVVCTTARLSGLQFLNTNVRVNAGTGTILEADARGIELAIESAIRAQVISQGDASNCSVQVNRTDNILSTQLLRIKVRVVPLGYAGNISEDIGFTNPAIVLS